MVFPRSITDGGPSTRTSPLSQHYCASPSTGPPPGQTCWVLCSTLLFVQVSTHKNAVRAHKPDGFSCLLAEQVGHVHVCAQVWLRRLGHPWRLSETRSDGLARVARLAATQARALGAA